MTFEELKAAVEALDQQDRAAHSKDEYEGYFQKSYSLFEQITGRKRVQGNGRKEFFTACELETMQGAIRKAEFHPEEERMEFVRQVCTYAAIRHPILCDLRDGKISEQEIESVHLLNPATVGKYAIFGMGL
jgi:hypothetical protein